MRFLLPYLWRIKIVDVTSDGEHAMMRTLHRNNIGCPLPVMNIHGAEKSMEKLNDGISTLTALIL